MGKICCNIAGWIWGWHKSDHTIFGVHFLPMHSLVYCQVVLAIIVRCIASIVCQPLSVIQTRNWYLATCNVQGTISFAMTNLVNLRNSIIVLIWIKIMKTFDHFVSSWRALAITSKRSLVVWIGKIDLCLAICIDWLDNKYNSQIFLFIKKDIAHLIWTQMDAKFTQVKH